MANTKSLIWVLIIFFGLYPMVTFGTIINVPTSQSTIQNGINSSVNGDTVLVSPGEYKENINFLGKKIVVASKYILTNDTSYISNTVIRGINNTSTVSFANNEDSLSILTGFTITNGLVGIYCQNSNPTLTFLKIENNASNDFGGGIKCINSNPLIKNTTIRNNQSRYDGGGFYCSNSNPIIMNSTIENNQSYQNGGGLYCSNSNPKLNNVVVSFNKSMVDGGGIYSENNSQPKILNSFISNNISTWYGGGIACYKSNAILDSVTISFNKSESWYSGGLHCEKSSPILTNVLITENNVARAVGAGAGGGGIGIIDSSNPYLSNVTITKNAALVSGGGIYIDAYSAITFDTVKRSNIYHNESTFGFEIFSENKEVHLVVDTFIVMKPSSDQLYPINNYTFDILHAKVSQENSVLYVSPNGNNENDGLSWFNPLKTIGYAKSIIKATSHTQGVIYLDSGLYSMSTNGERYGLQIWSNISMRGRGVNQTILEGNDQDGILHYSYVLGDTIENLSLTNGRSSFGGGIAITNSDVVLKNVIIRDCNGINGGAINVSLYSNVTIVNSLFFHNTATAWGGALYGGELAHFKLINVTITDNLANDNGGGIYCYAANVDLINSILWNNSPFQVYIYEFAGASEINAAYSDIQDGLNGIRYKGNGIIWYDSTNISTDPLFESSSGNYHLSNASPCIGVGIDSIQILDYFLVSSAVDIEQHLRADSLHTFPDIGAYEFLYEQPDNIEHFGKEIVSDFSLLQNFPNPFNPSTTFKYSIAHTSNVSIIVYNTLGQIVKELSKGTQSVGDYYIHFSGIELPSGVYFYTINAVSENGKDIFRDTKKMLLMK